MKIFLDANVLFTAAYSPNGKAHLLIELFRGELITSDYALEEARKNLQKKKPGAIAELDKILKNIKVVSTAFSPVCPIALPEKDRPIFLTALAEKVTHLLTGDIKDFGVFMNNKKLACGIIIQTVSDFFREE